MNASVALNQAKSALSVGDVQQVLDLFCRIVATESDLFPWILLLIEAGHLHVASEHADKLRFDEQARIRELLQEESGDWEGQGDPGDAYGIDDEVLRPRAEVQEELISLFLRFYGGRRDIYAKAWYDERRKRAGYHPVQQPLTESVVRAHLQGSMTIGQYLLYPDGACAYGVIDLDVSASVLQTLRVARGEEASALMHPPLGRYVLTLLDAGERLGLPLFAEDSGGRGVHLWLHMEPRRAASAVRAMLSQVIVAAGPIPPEVGVEVFPKQDRLGPRGLSSLVKLPLGVHPATLRRCALLDRKLKVYSSALEGLRALRLVPMDAVDAVVGRRVVPLPAPEITPVRAVPRLDTRPTPRSLAETLRQIEVGVPEKEAVDAVLRGCPVLAGLTKKAFENHSLLADEARALLYTIGLISPGPGVIDEVLASAKIPRRELDRLRRGLPNPAGCKKLSRLAPEGTCSCFEKNEVL
ncbi:MAG TPA: hypothetical protein PK710_23545, partial [Polyangiaceae bacterium]|nr:hypothetical protein [Polyangiaceae bacterium]